MSGRAETDEPDRAAPRAPGLPGSRRARSPVLVAPLRILDAVEFAASVRRSRALHHPWVAPPQEAADVRLLASRRSGPDDYAFVLRERASAAMVGYADITNIVRGVFQSGYLAYFVFAGFERRGFMKAGLGQVIRHAFGELGLHRLEANIQPGNVASIALVSALGFRKEGYSPKYLKLRGRWRDHERWALLRR